MKAHQKLLIALLCVLIACVAWSPTVLADDPPLPTAAQMAADPVVSAAIEQAWTDSQAGDKDNRHEEGGWIIQDTVTGNLSVQRWPAGNRSGINPGAPPQIPCTKVVGHFHTHPNPATDENGTKWEQGPSDADDNFAGHYGLPGIIRNGAGKEYFGPNTGALPHTPLPNAAGSTVIPDVPDTSQPPNQTLITTNPATNYCAPMAMTNILYYWDVIMGHANAAGVTAGLASDILAEYVGYFMDTNNTGSPDRFNGTMFMGAPGTYAADIGPGTLDFIRWDATHPFPVIPDPGRAPALPAGKSGYDWTVATQYQIPLGDEAGFDMYMAEIDAGRPLVVSFKFWNPEYLDVRFADEATGEVLYLYAWGDVVETSEDPQELWNMGYGEEGIGHAVTGVGYVPDWDPDGSTGPLPAQDYVIVHDNWARTPENIAIPWAWWNSLHTADPGAAP